MPIRMAEARLTLGVVAARAGELDEARADNSCALESARRSLPSLLMVAGEHDAVLAVQYPQEQTTEELRGRLRDVIRDES